MNRILTIDAYFDFICPWCLIGNRQLQLALELLAEAEPHVTPQVCWRGVQLLPQLPALGVPFGAFYRDRLGSDDNVRRRQAQVIAAAGQAGVRIDFSRIALMPNTADAHRLFELACSTGSDAQVAHLMERLYAAHFVLGENLGDGAQLLAIAESCGFPAKAMLPAMQGAGRPFKPALGGVAPGGVPHLVLDGWLSINGAQPPASLLSAMQLALSAKAAA